MKVRLVESENRTSRRTKVVAVAIGLVAAVSILWLGKTANSRTPASYETTQGVSVADDSAIVAVDRLSAFALSPTGSTGEFDEKRTAEGLRELAVVLDHVIAHDSLGASIYTSLPEDVRAHAAQLERERSSTARATIASTAFISVSEAVSVWQRRAYPHLERAASRLLDAALSLQADRPLIEQKGQIEDFFEVASDALRGMAVANP